MANESKLSQRDETLVKVLDRLSDGITQQSTLLDELGKRQIELATDMERNERRQLIRLESTDGSIEKTQEAVQRYRSDMLSLVNEQDRMNIHITEMSKKQLAIAYSQDNIVNIITDLKNRVESQEKTVHEINTHSINHEEALPREIGDMSRSVSKLHMDTEKRLVEMHKETQRLLDKMKVDIERRLIALDKIEASLEILLIRTEPPEKKPFILVRLFHRIRLLFMKIKIRWNERVRWKDRPRKKERVRRRDRKKYK